MSREPDLFVSTGHADQEAVSFLNELFKKAVQDEAADIHFLEQEGQCLVRLRLPVVGLKNYAYVDEAKIRVIDTKIRSRARLAANDHYSLMDGRMSLRVDGRNIDIRVSLAPGVSKGQLLVCRLLDQANAARKLESIEMSLPVYERMRSILRETSGLFVIAGPTGSGKTTTLYSMIHELNREGANIVTIENPVEYRISGIHQINVDSHVSFPKALRGALRLDPDVVVIGEIRDPETADVAVQAAMTGHLVLATIHANNAAGAITRFLQFGINPLTLATSLRGISSQRLIRRTHAGLPRQEPSGVNAKWLRDYGLSQKNVSYPDAGDGDESYSGYIPIVEMIIADRRVREAVPGGEEAVINAAAWQSQYETLAEAGERLAFEGKTSLGEVVRSVSGHDALRVTARRLGSLMMGEGLVTRETLRKILDEQAGKRLEGVYVPLGKLLVDSGCCKKEDVVRLSGYTSDASAIIEHVSRSESARQLYRDLVEKWIPGEMSLFEMAIESGLCSEKEIYDAMAV